MRLPKFDLALSRVVLTGAASGMGEQLAHHLASRGARLFLVDRDASRLAQVADEIARAHPDVSLVTMIADLADPEAPEAVAAEANASMPGTNLLVNNAGVAMGGTFSDLSADDFDWVMRVNFQAPVALCRALLPTLRSTPGSHIVNVSSMYGIIGPPGQSAYSSSKYAIRGFTEVLRHELGPEGIGVTTVHPGGIRTRIAESARAPQGADARDGAARREASAKLLSYPADKAAAAILHGVERRKARILIAWTAVVPDALSRLLPTSYYAVMTRLNPTLARQARAFRRAADLPDRKATA